MALCTTSSCMMPTQQLRWLHSPACVNHRGCIAPLQWLLFMQTSHVSASHAVSPHKQVIHRCYNAINLPWEALLCLLGPIPVNSQAFSPCHVPMRSCTPPKQPQVSFYRLRAMQQLLHHQHATCCGQQRPKRGLLPPATVLQSTEGWHPMHGLQAYRWLHRLRHPTMHPTLGEAWPFGPCALPQAGSLVLERDRW
jgi:hypothetical protein